MNKLKNVLIVMITSIALLSACSSNVGDLGSTMELVNSLGKFGVTPQQAVGGIGALISLTKGKLSADDFTKVATAFPDVDNILKQAEGIGAVTGPITDMAGVDKSFEKLGMDKSLVDQFIPEVTSFATEKGGAEVGSLIASALK